MRPRIVSLGLSRCRRGPSPANPSNVVRDGAADRLHRRRRPRRGRGPSPAEAVATRDGAADRLPRRRRPRRGPGRPPAGVVAPEKQGRLAAAIQIASGICVASGLALGYGLWLGLKTDDEHGSRGTRRDFAGASSFFATAGLFLLAAYVILPACALERERRATGMD